MNAPRKFAAARAPDLARALAPGLLLAAGVSLAAWSGERLLVTWVGRAVLEAIVLAIVIGTVVRAVAVG